MQHQELGRVTFGQRCHCHPWAGLGISSLGPPEELESFPVQLGFVQGENAAMWSKSKCWNAHAAEGRRNL